MNKAELVAHLEAVDRELRSSAWLCVYGSGVCILLDAPGRTSMDLDVAGPYSRADESDLRQAAVAAGFPVNPPEDYAGDHLEWVGGLRLCLPPLETGRELRLWSGRRLTVVSVPPAALIASKLIRYDAIDQADVRFLVRQAGVTFEQVAAEADRLPDPFRLDALVKENLGNLRHDMRAWEATP